MGALNCVFQIFERMRKASGLTLKPKKCVLIPLSIEVSRNNILRIQEWLRINVPEWIGFQIRAQGKYLGLLLGPGVAPKDNWNVPLNKMVERVSMIGEQGWPLDMLPGQFASKALSVLGYHGQFLFLPVISNPLNFEWPLIP